jgi:ElaB/YqjD/DUF883 family membrane-anchored ribosome-binding protein
MAEQIRVTREGADATGAHTHGAEITRQADVEATIPAHPGTATAAADPEMARAEIEMTRARMSETIDDIEDALVRRKEEIQDKLDVMSPVRERPLPSAGIAFGAGLLLGLLTGGDDDSDNARDIHFTSDLGDERTRYANGDDEAYWRRRAETWESRARRLRDVARDQEAEIRSLQEEWGETRSATLDHRPRTRVDPDEFDADESGGLRSMVGELREGIIGGVADFLTRTVHEMTGSGSSRRHS